MSSQKKISVNGSDLITEEEFEDFVWRIESCEEFLNCFEVDWMCPMCGEFVNREGVLIHKDPSVYKCN